MWTVLQNATWQDAVDIALLTFILYRILVMVKGTRTMPMIMGFILLLGLYLLSQTLELYATSIVLDNLATYIVLILVILFQADIRNALAQFGLITFFTGSHRFRRDLIDETLQACVQLSQKRIGGLIVFEREVGLRNFMDKGHILNAEVSKELLFSIFHPTSPLHDGAVMIDRKGTMVAARCLLPITMSTRLSPILGTRHRAALGLSEETDAAILVVSEERSEISLCFQGRIFRESKHENIKEIIITLLEGKKSNLEELLHAFPVEEQAQENGLIETQTQ